MLHIRAKNSSYDPHIAYTQVIAKGYGGPGEPPLTDHPSVVELPDYFEVVDEDIPEHVQYLNYTG